MQVSPYSVAEETLPKSSMQRGLGAMNSPVPKGSNLYDAGAASKPQVNSQPYNNERLLQQNMEQNISTAAPQAAAEAMGQVRQQANTESDAESKAQKFADQRKSEVIYANQALLSGDGGRSAMSLLGGMTDMESAKFQRDIATSKAIAAGLNPDLGDEAGSSRMYG